MRTPLSPAACPCPLIISSTHHTRKPVAMALPIAHPANNSMVVLLTPTSTLATDRQTDKSVQAGLLGIDRRDSLGARAPKVLRKKHIGPLRSSIALVRFIVRILLDDKRQRSPAVVGNGGVQQ